MKEYLKIEADGNVSLGTTNPSFKLKVNNSAATWQLIKQLRLLIMTWILHLALIVCPKSAIRTLLWFSEIPKDY